jgi:hypothetical protein
MKYSAAFTIENNHASDMKVSHFVIGYTRVDAFYKEYSSLPESERAFLVNDIFLYDDLDKALEDHMDAISREANSNKPSHRTNSWEIGGGKVGTTRIMNEVRDENDILIDCWVEELADDTSPRVIGRIELAEDSISSSNEYDCEKCGCETDSNRWGDTRHILNVRDEVYGTWSEQRICESCYYAHVEASLK